MEGEVRICIVQQTIEVSNEEIKTAAYTDSSISKPLELAEKTIEILWLDSMTFYDRMLAFSKQLLTETQGGNPRKRANTRTV